MKKLALLAASVAAFAATPAFAQDEASNVSFQVGGVVGYDSVKFSAGGDSESTDDVVYGITGGVDFNLGGAFVGAEAEWNDSEVGQSAEDVFVAGDEVSLGVGRTLYAGARLGANVSENAKLYVKGGYVNTKIEGAYDNGTTVFSDDEEIDGFLLGAGVEYKMKPVTVRVEYRYSDYGDLDLGGVATGIEATRHQVVAGLLFGF